MTECYARQQRRIDHRLNSRLVLVSKPVGERVNRFVQVVISFLFIAY